MKLMRFGRVSNPNIVFCLILYPAETGKGKMSSQANLKCGKTKTSNGEKTRTYHVKFYVESSFGIPGAFVIRNPGKHRFFLQSASFETHSNQIIQFDCHSWVYPSQKTKNFDRIFFSNTVSCIVNLPDLFYTSICKCN